MIDKGKKREKQKIIEIDSIRKHEISTDPLQIEMSDRVKVIEEKIGSLYAPSVDKHAHHFPLIQISLH